MSAYESPLVTDTILMSEIRRASDLPAVRSDEGSPFDFVGWIVAALLSVWLVRKSILNLPSQGESGAGEHVVDAYLQRFEAIAEQVGHPRRKNESVLALGNRLASSKANSAYSDAAALISERLYRNTPADGNDELEKVLVTIERESGAVGC